MLENGNFGDSRLEVARSTVIKYMYNGIGDVTICLITVQTKHYTLTVFSIYPKRISSSRLQRIVWPVPRSCLTLRVTFGPMCWRRASKSWSRRRRRGNGRRTALPMRVLMYECYDLTICSWWVYILLCGVVLKKRLLCLSLILPLLSCAGLKRWQ